MLKRDSDPSKVKLVGILIAIEVQMDEVNIEYILNRMSDAALCVEGVGTIETEFLGEMDLEDEPPQGSV